MNKYLLIAFLFLGCKSEDKLESQLPTVKPNIVIIYADDLGYGELGAYGATELKKQ